MVEIDLDAYDREPEVFGFYRVMNSDPTQAEVFEDLTEENDIEPLARIKEVMATDRVYFLGYRQLSPMPWLFPVPEREESMDDS